MNKFKRLKGKNMRCSICESLATSLKKKVNGANIYKCRKCGLKWADGISETEITSLYSKAYFNNDSKIGYKNYLADEESHRKNAQNILNALDKINNINGARILDIGCAAGFLLDEVRKKKNCDIFGIELSSYLCEYARNRLNLNVLNCDLNSCSFTPRYFDVVFLIGTMEHLLYPKDTLIAIKSILKPDGLLVLTTIDISGLLPFYSIKPPEHIFYFNHNNLRILLNKIGLGIISNRTHFSNYRLHDLLHRLSEFLSIPVLGRIIKSAKKIIPNVNVKIPTNEMFVIAKKDSIS